MSRATISLHTNVHIGVCSLLVLFLILCDSPRSSVHKSSRYSRTKIEYVMGLWILGSRSWPEYLEGHESILIQIDWLTGSVLGVMEGVRAASIDPPFGLLNIIHLLLNDSIWITKERTYPYLAKLVNAVVKRWSIWWSLAVNLYGQIIPLPKR